MNIFPEADAAWYVHENSCKHEAMVMHNYKCMSNFCLTHNFKRSAWNRLSSRRIAIILSRQLIKNHNIIPFDEIKITPDDAYFVRTEELCTDLSEVKLKYHLEPAVQDVNFFFNNIKYILIHLLRPGHTTTALLFILKIQYNCDIYSLLTSHSIDKSKKKQQNTTVQLKWYVGELLQAIQPLSFSL